MSLDVASDPGVAQSVEAPEQLALTLESPLNRFTPYEERPDVSGPGLHVWDDGFWRAGTFRDFAERSPGSYADMRQLVSRTPRIIGTTFADGEFKRIQASFAALPDMSDEYDYEASFVLVLRDQHHTTMAEIRIAMSTNEEMDLEEFGDKKPGRFRRLMDIEPLGEVPMFLALAGSPNPRASAIEQMFRLALRETESLKFDDWRTFGIKDSDERAAMAAIGALQDQEMVRWDLNEFQLAEQQADLGWALPISDRMKSLFAQELAAEAATPVNRRVRWGSTFRVANGFGVDHSEFSVGDQWVVRAPFTDQPRLLAGCPREEMLGLFLRDRFPYGNSETLAKDGIYGPRFENRAYSDFIYTDVSAVVTKALADGFSLAGDLSDHDAARLSAVAGVEDLASLPHASVLHRSYERVDPSWPTLCDKQQRWMAILEDGPDALPSGETEVGWISDVSESVHKSRLGDAVPPGAKASLLSDYQFEAGSAVRAAFDRLELIANTRDDAAFLLEAGFVEVDPSDLIPPFAGGGFELADSARVFVLYTPRSDQERVKIDAVCAIG